MGSSTPNKVRVRFIILDGARAAWPVFCFLRVTKAACRPLVICLLFACRLRCWQYLSAAYRSHTGRRYPIVGCTACLSFRPTSIRPAPPARPYTISECSPSCIGIRIVKKNSPSAPITPAILSSPIVIKNRLRNGTSAPLRPDVGSHRNSPLSLASTPPKQSTTPCCAAFPTTRTKPYLTTPAGASTAPKAPPRPVVPAPQN